MNKFFFTIVLAVLGVTIAYGQKIKTQVLPVAENVVLKSVLPAWDEQTTYAFIIPQKLNYYDGQRGHAGKEKQIVPDIPGVKAKRVKPEEHPDYTIELVCPGIRYISKKNETYNAMSAEVVGVIRYEFQAKLVVTDKTGQLVKVFLLHSDHPLKTIFHPHFLDACSIVDSKAEIQAMGGFANVSALEQAYGHRTSPEGLNQRKNVYARIEYNALHESLETAKQLLAAAYGEQALPASLMLVGIHEKQKANYPELVGEIEHLSALIKQYIADPMGANVQKELILAGEGFAARCNTEGASKDMLGICGFNSSMAYLLARNERFSGIYPKAEANLGMFSKARIAFYRNFSVLNARIYASLPGEQVDCTLPLTLQERYKYIEMLQEDSVVLAKKMQDANEYKRLKAHNVIGAGQILTLRGDKYEGEIHMYFVRLKVNPENAIYSTAASVFFNGSNQGMQIACKEIQEVRVGERIFEPVAEHNVADSKFQKMLLGEEWNSLKLFEKLYENQGYIVYRDWSNYKEESYLIKRKDLEYACRLADILLLSPAANEYYKDKPEIQEQIKKNVFQPASLEGATALADALLK